MSEKEYVYVVLVKALTGLGKLSRKISKYEYTHIAVYLEKELQDFLQILFFLLDSMENLFIEYCLKGIKDMKNLPEVRRKKLKEKIKKQDYIRVMEASNGLSGLIVENTKAGEKEYDAMWISSLCDSAFKGMPDNEIVDFTSRVRTIDEIMEVTTKPVIVDGDTGGKIEHFVNHINTLERIGVSAIVIEDKKGLKQNSILGNQVVHTLEEKEDFQVICYRRFPYPYLMKIAMPFSPFTS